MKRNFLSLMLSFVMIVSMCVPMSVLTVSAADITSGTPFAENTVGATPNNSTYYGVTASSALASGTKCVAVETVFTPKSGGDTRFFINTTLSFAGVKFGVAANAVKTGNNANATGITYKYDTEYKLLYELNFETGYYRLTLTPTVGGASIVKDFIGSTYTDNQVTTYKGFGWYTVAAGTEFKSVKVWASSDTNAVAPSSVADGFTEDFESCSTNAKENLWSDAPIAGSADTAVSSAANIAGNSGKIFSKYINVPSGTEYLISNFSIKGVSSFPSLIYFKSTDNNYATADNRILQLSPSSQTIGNKGFSTFTLAADKWYDFKLESDLNTGYTKLTITDKDGNTESYEDVPEGSTAITSIKNAGVTKFGFALIADHSDAIYLDDIKITSKKLDITSPEINEDGYTATIVSNSSYINKLLSIVGTYDRTTGKMVGLNWKELDVSSAANVINELGILTSGDYVYEAYIWDLTNMKSLAEPLMSDSFEPTNPKHECDVTLNADSYPQRVTFAVVPADSVFNVSSSADILSNAKYIKEFIADSAESSVKFDMDAPLGYYRTVLMYSGSDGVPVVSNDTFPHSTDEDIGIILGILNTAGSSAESDIADCIYVDEDTYILKGFDKDLYTVLDGNSDGNIISLFIDARENFYNSSFADMAEVNEALAKALMVYEINKIPDVDSAASLATDVIDKYKEKSALSDAEFFYLYEDDKASVAAKLIEHSDFSDTGVFYKLIGDTLILNKLSGAHYTNVGDILTKNKTYIGIDMANYNVLEDTSEVDKAIIARSYSDTAELASYFAELTPEKKQTSSVSTAPSSSTKPSSNNSGSPVSGTVTIPSIMPNSPAKVFTDMAGYAWANEAVDYLSEKGVIDGNGNGEFEPERKVKREEFVKMAVMAFYELNTGADVSFADITKSHWSYPYIATAVNFGFIKGISGSEFGVGRDISREDAAVILWRICALAAKAPRDFADFSEISDYAIAAVNGLSSLGVINGDDSGRFNPKAGASRAEAAKMIYELIMIKEAGR